MRERARERFPSPRSIERWIDCDLLEAFKRKRGARGPRPGCFSSTDPSLGAFRGSIAHRSRTWTDRKRTKRAFNLPKEQALALAKKNFDRMVFLSLSLTSLSSPAVLSPSSNKTTPARAPQGRGMASVMNFYTDDSPGIKMSPVSFFFERAFSFSLSF